MIERIKTALNAGLAIVASSETLDELESQGVEVRSAHNRRRVGTRDEWVIWLNVAPIDLEFRADMTAIASGLYLSETSY